MVCDHEFMIKITTNVLKVYVPLCDALTGHAVIVILWYHNLLFISFCLLSKCDSVCSQRILSLALVDSARTIHQSLLARVRASMPMHGTLYRCIYYGLHWRQMGVSLPLYALHLFI